MRDSAQIEQLAVAHIVETFSSCRRICSCINCGDREPLWDGFLYLYDSDEHNVNTLKGRVACQVKGKDTSSRKSSESYYLSREELSNYLRDGGVMFFMVHVGLTEKTSYWAMLTPVELRSMLKKLEDKKTKGKTIKLARIPSNLNACEAEVFQFYQHCQMQKAPAVDVSAITKAGTHFQIIGVEQSNLPPIVALTKGFHYLYNCDENDNVVNVVGDTQYAFEIKREIDNCVIVGDVRFPVPVRLVAAKGESYVEVGDFLRIDIVVNGEKRKLKFSVESVHGVRSRLLAYQILLAMNEAEVFSFPAINTSISCGEVRLSNENLHDIKRELENARKVVNLMDCLHIKSDLDLDTLSKRDVAELNTLYGAILENKQVYPSMVDEKVVMTNVRIGDLTILVWLIKSANGYYVRDFFGSMEYEMAVAKSDSDEKFSVSRFAVLRADDYLRFSNIDLQLIPSDYKSLDLKIVEVANQTNMDALNLLTAYDKSSRSEILEAALRLTSWLTETCRESDEYIIYRINNLQAIKRSRELSEEETGEIVRYAEDNSASMELRFCCDLLLDDQKRANIHFYAMPKEQQDFYRTLPITRFWDKIG